MVTLGMHGGMPLPPGMWISITSDIMSICKAEWYQETFGQQPRAACGHNEVDGYLETGENWGGNRNRGNGNHFLEI